MMERPLRNWLLLAVTLGVASSCCALCLAQPLAPASAPYAASTTLQPPAAAPAALKPIYTRQSVFAIPFKVDGTASGSQRPVGVQLHVSEDGGVSWRLYEQVDPGASKFTFHAPYDGDYQFFVRTLDAAGRLMPPNPPAGELRVVVDTLAPRLDLEAKQAPSGEVAVNWRMLDRHLRPESFRLEYQAPGETTWRPVAVPHPMAGQRVDSGEVTFWPGSDAAKVLVRAQVIDEAGNPAVAQRELSTATSPANTNIHTAASRKDPQHAADESAWQSIDDQPSPGAVRWQPQAATEPLRPPARATVEEIGPPAAVESIGPGQPLPALTNSGPRSAPQFGHASTASRLPPVAPSADREPPPASFYEELPTQEPVAPPKQATPPPATAGAIVPADEPRHPKPDNTVDALKQGFEASGPSLGPLPGTARSNFNWDHLPPGEEPLMVNSRRFEFDYEVEAAGTVGIAKVEVWGTRDGGQTWSSYGVDADNRSPVSVAVEQEGLYGFRLVVQAASGLGSVPPRAGDTPDIWVGVDRTKPTVKMVDAAAEPEQGYGILRIRWQADDAKLSPNPINISYGEKPGGPWVSIADNLDNVGEYAWKIDRQLPDKVYLRVQARDAAGNTAFDESSDPVSLVRLRPQGRIREVRPAQEAQRNSSWSIVR